MGCACSAEDDEHVVKPINRRKERPASADRGFDDVSPSRSPSNRRASSVVGRTSERERGYRASTALHHFDSDAELDDELRTQKLAEVMGDERGGRQLLLGAEAVAYAGIASREVQERPAVVVVIDQSARDPQRDAKDKAKRAKRGAHDPPVGLLEEKADRSAYRAAKRSSSRQQRHGHSGRASQLALVPGGRGEEGDSETAPSTVQQWLHAVPVSHSATSKYSRSRVSHD